MADSRDEVMVLRRLKDIQKKYHIELSDRDLEAIAGGTFDYKGFVENFPVPSEVDKPPKRNGTRRKRA